MFAWVVGLGALLLFQVQLVLGKQLLPRFGGTSAVWTTCLLFFQAALLGGYAWAHLVSSRLSPRRQRDAHLALLGAAVAMLAWRAVTWPSPITPAAGGRVAAAPGAAILAWLAATIGLPFLVLAATSPLLQAWFARVRPGASPFWLFALSNAGSLAGLVAYPLVVEPSLPVLAQGRLWSLAFVAYAGGVAWCAQTASRTDACAASHPEGGSRPAPEGSAPRAALWLALAFVPSVLLAAVTSHLTQEVAAVPLLWVIPLALYLTSFILAFAWPDAFRRAWRVALAAAAGLATFGLFAALELEPGVRVALWCAVLLVYATASHGEVARLRPAPARLTGYYLAIAAGGALGGLFCAILAPIVFDGYWELHLGLLLGPIAVLAGALADPSSHATTEAPRDDGDGGTEAARDDGDGGTEAPRDDGALVRQLRVAAVLAVATLAVALGTDVVGQRRGVERASRGFYGVLRVVREGRGDPDERLRLLHGRISHGLQLVAPSRRAEATTYYGPASGVGAALRRHPRRRAGHPMRVGVVGLGVGTLAAYSRPGDVFRFYELDAEVARLSQGPEPVFTFLRDARGQTSVTLGDGRVALEGEEPQAFDVLVLDGFSSDAVPAHLLTREAFAAYLRHLAEGGVLAVHVTNRHLDLEPVVRASAAALGLQAEKVPSLQNGLVWSADWMLVARDRALLDDEEVSAGTLPWPYRDRDVLWTDAWSDVLGVLKR